MEMARERRGKGRGGLVFINVLSFREREFFRHNNGGKAKFRKRQVLNSNPTLVVYYRLEERVT